MNSYLITNINNELMLQFCHISFPTRQIFTLIVSKYPHTVTFSTFLRTQKYKKRTTYVTTAHRRRLLYSNHIYHNESCNTSDNVLQNIQIIFLAYEVLSYVNCLYSHTTDGFPHLFQNNCVFTFYVCSYNTMCSLIQTILNKSHGIHTQKHNTTKLNKLEFFFIYISLPSCMKFIVQTDRCTQTNTRTHMHARIRTQTQVPECPCPLSIFF